jgi:hypothetical protein
MRRKLSPLTPLGLEDGARARSTLLETGLTTARGALAHWLQPCLRWLAGVGATLGESAARRRPRPLVLDLTAGSVRFRSVSEFEFALSSKTGFPVAKIPDIVRRPAWELKKVATHIRHVEKRFAEVLTQSLEQPGLVGELMREVEIKLFSQDHGWRDLVEALNQKGSEHDQKPTTRPTPGSARRCSRPRSSTSSRRRGPRRRTSPTSRCREARRSPCACGLARPST